MASTTATAASLTLSFSSLDSPQPPIFLKTPHKSSFPTTNKPLSLCCTPSSPSYPAQHSLPKLHISHSSSPRSSSSTAVSNDPLPTSQFLGPHDVRKKEILETFRNSHNVDRGSLDIRPMCDEDVAATIELLTESFAESMSVPPRLVKFLEFLVKQYVLERRALLPHAAMLVGFFKGNDGKEELAGTVEISFDAKGANMSHPTPVPPKDSPYICNMAVKKALRRRGIGHHLLKDAEKLISRITTSIEVYLHCRMIDKVPLRMYTKAGYEVVKTDSILILLIFQRRKHLMRKKLLESDDLHISGPDD